MTKGEFITYEGGEGAGKTVQTQMMKMYLEGKGFDVVLTREPGGVKVAEQIRNILIGPDVEDMDALTEVFLYAAARREHYLDVIKPALDAGKTVISDRFFDTSLVYQGLVKGQRWNFVHSINLKAVEDRSPGLTIYLDIEPEKALSRIKANSEREVNRFDKASLDFHHQVREGYLALCQHFANRIRKVNADQTPGNVYFDCVKIVDEKLGLNKKKEEKLESLYSLDSSSLKYSASQQNYDLIINPTNNQEPLLFLGNDGTIKWNGRVVTKDEDLVAALRDLLTHTR